LTTHIKIKIGNVSPKQKFYQ